MMLCPRNLQMLNARSAEQQQLPTISVNVTDQASQLRCAESTFMTSVIHCISTHAEDYTPLFMQGGGVTVCSLP